MLASSALELVRCKSFKCSSNTKYLHFQVLGQCTGTLHPGWGEAVLVGCPPLTQKMEVNSNGFIFISILQVLALPFILQGLSMRGSLMGGWKNSLSAIPQLVQVISS